MKRILMMALGVALVVVIGMMQGCSPVSTDSINAAKDRIEKDLKGDGIYERGNLPEDFDEEELLNGYFDIVDGAYRYIVNEERADRNLAAEIEDGDVVEIFFDARIYRSNFDSSITFYTNIESRRSSLAGTNPEFDPTYWRTDPLKIELSNDSHILKSVQRALVGCRASQEQIVIGEDGQQTIRKIESDVVRIYLTPDVGFGDSTVYNVPAGSTLVFEVTDIKIMEI